MRKALILLAGVASLAALSSAAVASDGCGAGWHRNDHGRCRPNHDTYRGNGYRNYGYRSGVVVEPEGSYYQDRDSDDGDRYYSRRDWDGSSRY